MKQGSELFSDSSGSCRFVKVLCLPEATLSLSPNGCHVFFNASPFTHYFYLGFHILMLKAARERREEHQRLLASRELNRLEREQRARRYYEQQLQERKKKLLEQRIKEERRRAAVEEKRKQRLKEEKERHETAVRRTLEKSQKAQQNLGQNSRGRKLTKNGTNNESSSSLLATSDEKSASAEENSTNQAQLQSLIVSNLPKDIWSDKKKEKWLQVLRLLNKHIHNKPFLRLNMVAMPSCWNFTSFFLRNANRYLDMVM
uniref:Microtubule-associated protein 7a n=1 Tax=Acanthochromis polyacanthus TaxID=80966 RepID=A0A3Q1ETI3_9TELE